MKTIKLTGDKNELIIHQLFSFNLLVSYYNNKVFIENFNISVQIVIFLSNGYEQWMNSYRSEGMDTIHLIHCDSEDSKIFIVLFDI